MINNIIKACVLDNAETKEETMINNIIKACVLDNAETKEETMINNIEKAYCMAQLEDKIRWERRSIDNYVAAFHGEEMTGKYKLTYKHMLSRWSAMITAYECAFETPYFNQY